MLDIIWNFINNEPFGIVFTVFFVDTAIKYRERSKWKQPRNFIYMRLFEITGGVYCHIDSNHSLPRTITQVSIGKAIGAKRIIEVSLDKVISNILLAMKNGNYLLTQETLGVFKGYREELSNMLVLGGVIFDENEITHVGSLLRSLNNIIRLFDVSGDLRFINRQSTAILITLLHANYEVRNSLLPKIEFEFSVNEIQKTRKRISTLKNEISKSIGRGTKNPAYPYL